MSIDPHRRCPDCRGELSRAATRCQPCKVAHRRALRDASPVCPKGVHPWPASQRWRSDPGPSGTRSYCAPCLRDSYDAWVIRESDGTHVPQRGVARPHREDENSLRPCVPREEPGAFLLAYGLGVRWTTRMVRIDAAGDGLKPTAVVYGADSKRAIRMTR